MKLLKKTLAAVLCFAMLLSMVTPVAAETEIPESSIQMDAVMEETQTATGITIATLPDKVEYKLGEEFDPTGMVVLLNYEGGLTQDVTAECEVLWYDPETLGEQTLEVCYGDWWVELIVTVVEPVGERYCVYGHTTHEGISCEEALVTWTELDPKIEELPITPGNYYFPEGSTVTLKKQVNTDAASGTIRFDLRGSTVNQTGNSQRVMLVNGGANVTFCDTVGGSKLVYTNASHSESGAVLFSHTGTLRVIGDITVDASAVTTHAKDDEDLTAGAITVNVNGNLFVDGATIKGGAASEGGAIYHRGVSMTIKNATIKAGTVTAHADGRGSAIHAIKDATLENCTIEGNVYNAATLTVKGGEIESVLHDGGQASLSLQGDVKINNLKLVNDEGWGKVDALGANAQITLVNGSWGYFADQAAAQAAIASGMFKAAEGYTLVAYTNGGQGRIIARPVRCIYGHTSHAGIDCDEDIVTWTLLTVSSTKNLPAASGNYYFKDGATVNLTAQAGPTASTEYKIRVDLRGATVKQTAADRVAILKGTASSFYVITSTNGQAKIVTTQTSTTLGGSTIYANIGTMRLINVDVDCSSYTDVKDDDFHVLGAGKLVLENCNIKGNQEAACPTIKSTDSANGTVTIKNSTVEGGYYISESATKTFLEGVVKLLPGTYKAGFTGGAAIARLDCTKLAAGSEIVANNLSYDFKDAEAAAAAKDVIIKAAADSGEIMADGHTLHAGVVGQPTSMELFKLPTKLAYDFGEDLDTKGMEVRVKYANGTYFAVREYEVSGYDRKTSGTQTVTVSFEGVSATFEVTVAEEVAITALTVTAPAKVDYLVGEELDLDGMKIVATYADGTTKTITKYYEMSAFDPNTLGEQTITITYEGFTASFTVEVQEPAIYCIYGHKTHEGIECDEEILEWVELDPKIEELPVDEGNYFFPEGSTVTLKKQVNTSADSGHIRIDLRGSTVTQVSNGHRVMLVNGGSTVTFCDTVGGGKLVRNTPTVTTDGSGHVLYVYTGTLNIIGNITVDASAVVENMADQSGGAIYVNSKGGILNIEDATVKGGKVAKGGAIYYAGESMTLKNATIEGAPATGTGAELIRLNANNVVFEDCTINGKVLDCYDATGKTVTIKNGYMAEYVNYGGQDTLKLEGAVVIDKLEQDLIVAWGKTDSLSGDYKIGLYNASWGPFESKDAAQAAIDAGKFYAVEDDITVFAVANGETGRVVARPYRCVYGHSAKDHETVECSEELIVWEPHNMGNTLPKTSGNYYVKDGAQITLTGQADVLDANVKHNIRVDLRGATVKYAGNTRLAILRGLEGAQYVITDTKGGAKIVSTGAAGAQSGGGSLFYCHNNGTIRLIDVDVNLSSFTSCTSGNDIYINPNGRFIAENCSIVGNSAPAVPCIAHEPSGKTADGKAMPANLILKNVSVTGGYYVNGSLLKTKVEGKLNLLAGVGPYGIYGSAPLAELNCTKIDVSEGASRIEATNLNFKFQDEETAAAALNTIVIPTADTKAVVDKDVIHTGLVGELTEIYIYVEEGKEPAYKTEYAYGEELTFDGLDLRGTYSDGEKTATIQIRGYEATGYDPKVSGKQTVTLNYNGFTATYDVTVAEPKMTGIEVTAPTKTEYVIGELLDPTGMTINAVYEDESKTPVELDACEITGFDSETAGEKTVTVKVGEFTATLTVTVKEPVVLTGITVTAPTKTEYEIGEELDLTGMVVTGTYSDETTAEITEGITTEGFTSEAAGEVTVTVKVGEFTATFTVTVKEAEPEEPAIEIVASGNCGPKVDGEFSADVTWTLDVEGTLTISGEGAMAEFTKASAPWKAYRQQIKAVVVEDGVTSIGAYAFYLCKQMTSITIPETVINISKYATMSCTKLKTVEYGAHADVLGMITKTGNEKLLGATVNAYQSPYEKIEVVSAPTKLVYEAGEAFDFTGMDLQFVDAEGNKTPVKDFIFFGFDTTKLVDQTVVLSAEGQYVTFKVNVRETGYCGNETIDGVKGANITYVLTNETLELTGTGRMANYSTKTKLFNASRELVKTIKINEGITITGEYAFFYLHRLVTVYLPKSLERVSYATFFQSATKTKAEAIVNVFFAGTKYQWETGVGGLDDKDKPLIRDNNNPLKNCTNLRFMETAKIERLEVTKLPDKLVYVSGEKFDSTGLVVTGYYSDGQVKEVIPNDIEGFNTSNPTTQKLTVKYGSGSTTFDVEVTAGGTCPNGMNWSIRNNVLTISGEGAMETYTNSTQPWKGFRNYIKEIVFAEGITEIGTYAAYYCKKITTVYIPSTVTKINSNAFASSVDSVTVVYAGTEEAWKSLDVKTTGNGAVTKGTMQYAPAQ